MARKRRSTKTPTIDMTPMVDLAFLLVTFFMLTTKFRPTEAVEVKTPTSTAQIPVPDIDIITVTVANDGRVFFDMDNKYNRRLLINGVDERFGLGLSEDNKNTFAVLQTFGVPFNQLKGFLSMKSSERDQYKQPGIPIDSVGANASEFANWILFAQSVNRTARYAIKGDGESPYIAVKGVMNILQDLRINRFNLLTSLEGGAEAIPK